MALLDHWKWILLFLLSFQTKSCSESNCDVIYLDDLQEQGHHIDGYVKDSSISCDLAMELLLFSINWLQPSDAIL